MGGLRQFSITLRLALCLSLTSLYGQGREDFTLPKLSPEESAKVLADVRGARLGADVCFRFETVHRPRRGEQSPPVKGLLWAGTRGDTHLIRIEMQDQAATRILARKSPSGSAVSVRAAGATVTVAPGSFKALSPGLLVSAFDLQLPFTHWPDVRYVATERGRRPMHVFTAKREDFAGEVSFGVDRAYGAILQATVRSPDDKALRTLAVEDFAKAGDQWVIGTCSIRDELSRDTDLLRFTEAALGLRLDDSIFTEGSLQAPATPSGNFLPL
ncbi:MAG: hypothetical protein ACO3ND_07605 [Opitutales bacterium]